MQHKDTIIVAVLLNLSILAALFLFSVNETDVVQDLTTVSVQSVPKKQVAAKKGTKSLSHPKVATQETIEEVLKNYSLTKKEVAAAEPERVKPPEPQPVKKKVAKLPQQNKEVQEEYYVVQRGDNPWTIAKKFSVDFEDIVKLNNFDEKKARNLKPGDQVRVR